MAGAGVAGVAGAARAGGVGADVVAGSSVFLARQAPIFFEKMRPTRAIFCFFEKTDYRVCIFRLFFLKHS